MKKCTICKGDLYYLDDESGYPEDLAECGDCGEIFEVKSGKHVLYSHTLKRYIVDPQIPEFMRL